MLTEALLKLQSIQSIQIRNVYSNPSYSMSTAPRHPSGKQRSLGLRRILLKQEETIEAAASRERPTVAADDHSERACLYSTLLALGRAGTRPEELEVTNNVGFDCKTFHIPACIASSVIPVLGQLEVLLLSISPGTSVGPVRGPSLPGVRPQNITTHDVRIFLQYMPRLRTIRLRFSGLENRYDGFIEWLASAPSGATQDTLPQTPPAIAFSCLQGLFLPYILGIHVQDLILVVRKLVPTLQNLKFNWVHLETSLHDHTSAPSGPGSVWTEFLHSLKIELSNELRWLCLSEVMDTEHTDLTHNTLRVSRDVIFAKGQKHYQACSYSGPAMRQALEAMIHYIEGDNSWASSTWEGNWRFYHGKHGTENDLKRQCTDQLICVPRKIIVGQDCQPSASV